MGSIPGSGRSPEEGMATPPPPSILAWRMPWTEEPSGLQSKHLQDSNLILALLIEPYTRHWARSSK